MSGHEVSFPSPPPDTHLHGPMSGLFSRRNGTTITLHSDVITLDTNIDASARRKVEFQPWTTNIAEAHLSTPDSEVTPSLKSLPPSRECRLNVRPILKTNQSLESIAGFDGQNEKKSVLDTMESLLQNLAVDDRSSSVDAYQTMTNLIKTYDEPPEQDVLQVKMAHLQKYIKRDLVVLDSQIESLTSEDRLSMGNLVMSALKVLVTMVWSPVYSPCLSDDFRSWTLDRAILVLKEHTAAKAVQLHYMHLVATQNYRSTLLMNNQRAFHVLEALQDLTDHVTGKAVIAERVLVYQKLMEQARSVMKSRAELWMKNFINALSHSFKEVRINAISLGTKLCTAFAGDSKIAAKVRETLSEVTNERTLSMSTTNRLERVLAAKDEANQIPQIWTIVLMLCNCKSTKLEDWEQLHDWLRLIQRCFNSSDSSVRMQAFMAWNRLYYIANPIDATDKVNSVLAKPAVTQLDRTGHNASSKLTRQAVVSSYAMLLYYAFRPSATHQQTTRMWNEFIVKVMTSSFLSKSAANCDLCCRLLAALFYNKITPGRVWNGSRAHENAPLDPLELPTIDVKWTRSKMSSILTLMKLLVKHGSFGPNGAISDQSYVAQAWRNLMQALRESMSKEIKMMTESRVAIDSIIDFFRQRTDSDDAEQEQPVPIERLEMLGQITVAELGPTPIVQVLENAPNANSPLLVQCLVRELSFTDDPNGLSLANEKLLSRCLSLLANEVDNLIKNEKKSSTIEMLQRLPLLLTTADQLPLNQIRYFLQAVQPALTTLIDGYRLILADTQDNDLETAVVDLCKVVIDLTFKVPLMGYTSLDEILPTIMQISNSDVKRYLLDAWTSTSRLQESFSYGPKFLRSVSLLEADLSENLPGIPQSTKTSASHTRQLNGETVGTPKASTRSSSSRSTRQKGQKKPQHVDSRTQFVSIDSSPPDYENFESQLLTSRQKGGRARQKAEPVLTFADIRSSPSVEKKSSKKSNARRSKSPELPTTPTLPQHKAQEGDDQPTPTPKARRSLQMKLQPDVPSSPPSVVDGHDRSSSANAITSSPIKDVMEADDAVQLSNHDALEVQAVVQAAADLEAATVGESEAHIVSNDLQYDVQAAVTSPERDQAHLTPLVAEQFGIAIAELDSVGEYSDEIDALAASQLSQNLADEGRATSAQPEIEETPLKTPPGKRKRATETSSSQKQKKKRRSDGRNSEEVELPAVRVDDEDAEMEDCIVVNTDAEDSQPRKRGRPRSSVTPRPVTTEIASPLPLSESQQSVASTISMHTSKRGKGRPKKIKKQKSQQSQASSRDVSPSTHVLVDKVREEPQMEDEYERADVRGASRPEAPSLAPEVKKTAGDEQNPDTPPIDMVVDEPIGPVLPKEVPVEELPAKEVSIDNADADEEQPAQQVQARRPLVLDLETQLTEMLCHLDTPEVKDVELDLPAIHSLLFRIGLKAQELSQARR